MMAGLAVMLPVIVGKLGGFEAFLMKLPEGRFRMYPDGGTSLEWFHYIRAWMVIGLGNIAGQDLLQRSLSAKNESVAQNSAYISTVIYLTFGLLPVFAGMAGSLLMPNLANPELIIPKLAMEYLPTVFVVLFISALLAAVMSSADSSILACSSVLANNLVPFFNPSASDKNILEWSRFSVPLFALLSMSVALYIGEVYKLLLDSFGILLVGLFVPFTTAIWWKKANSFGALSSMLLGTSAWIIFLYIAPHLPSDIIGVAVGAAAMFVVTLLSQRKSPPLPLRDIDGNVVAFDHRLGTLNPLRKV